jgi:serine/threonine protein kinase
MSRKDIPPKMLNMEILALKTLQGAENENIVKIYEIVKRDKDMDIFIIMEKCSEGDLNFYRKHRQDQNLPFEPLKVKKLITDIANAYKACIKSGIIHRDIKPANILIRNNMFLLTDFGMSCIIDGIGKRRHLTRLGSPFAAPQILHDNPYSNKCDVYSVNFMFMV